MTMYDTYTIAVPKCNFKILKTSIYIASYFSVHPLRFGCYLNYILTILEVLGYASNLKIYI